MIHLPEKKIYVGCGLTSAPLEFREQVQTLKSTLSDSFSVLEFLGLSLGNAVDVYRHDMACVEESDAVIAVADLPSTGLGVEIERARALGKPVLAFANETSNVTRLLLGMAEDEPNVSFSYYRDMNTDIPSIFSRQLLEFE